MSTETKSPGMRALESVRDWHEDRSFYLPVIDAELAAIIERETDCAELRNEIDRLHCRIERLERQRDELAKALERQKELAEAQRRLNVAYRLGKRPSEDVFNVLCHADEISAEVDAAIAKARGESK